MYKSLCIYHIHYSNNLWFHCAIYILKIDIAIFSISLKSTDQSAFTNCTVEIASAIRLEIGQ